MNANCGHSFLSRYALPAFVVLFFGCDDSAMNPNDTLLRTSDIENIVWTLDSPGYEPFRLIFNEEQFFGYDGCNWYGGRYEARNDSIFPRDLIQTERACNVRTFPLEQLATPFLMRITKAELRIFTCEGRFTFKSDVAEGIVESPLLRNWILTASSDPEVDQILAQQLTPALSFENGRGFRITWNCATDDPNGCDEIFGIFGVGGGGRIFFFKTGWRTHFPGLEFVERILSSSSYRVETGTSKEASLTLVNTRARARYEFTAISRND